MITECFSAFKHQGTIVIKPSSPGHPTAVIQDYTTVLMIVIYLIIFFQIGLILTLSIKQESKAIVKEGANTATFDLCLLVTLLT